MRDSVDIDLDAQERRERLDDDFEAREQRGLAQADADKSDPDFVRSIAANHAWGALNAFLQSSPADVAEHKRKLNQALDTVTKQGVMLKEIRNAA